jgi:hypothetical protein
MQQLARRIAVGDAPETNRDSWKGPLNALLRLATDTRAVDDEQADRVDRRVRQGLAEISSGFSLVEIALAWLDWASHMAISPGKSWQLQENLLRKLLALGAYNVGAMLGGEPQPPSGWTERRFGGDSWQRWPFNVFAQTWLIGRRPPGGDARCSGVRPENLEWWRFSMSRCWKPCRRHFPLTNPEIVHGERGGTRSAGSLPADDIAARQITGLWRLLKATRLAWTSPARRAGGVPESPDRTYNIRRRPSQWTLNRCSSCRPGS